MKHTQNLKSLRRKLQVRAGCHRFTWRVSGFWAWISVLVCGFLSGGGDIRVSLLKIGTSPSGKCYCRSVISYGVPFLKPEIVSILDEGFGTFYNYPWPFLLLTRAKNYKHTRCHSQNGLHQKSLCPRALLRILALPQCGGCTHLSSSTWGQAQGFLCCPVSFLELWLSTLCCQIFQHYFPLPECWSWCGFTVL